MNSEILASIFEDSKQNKKIIHINLDLGDGDFWCGYVTDYNEEFVMLHHFTKYGKSDGEIIEQIERIESIEYDDDYSKCMQYIIDNSWEIDVEADLDFKLPETENWQFEFLSQQVGLKNSLCRLELLSEIFTGFIAKLNDQVVLVHLVGRLGEDNGYATYKIEDIISVRINDIESRKRLLLYNWRKG